MSTNLPQVPVLKYSGLISDHDPLHAPLPVEIADLAELVSDESAGVLEHFGRAGIIVPPDYVRVGRLKIPQWAPTVRAEVKGFDPAHDCNGNFMSYKYQANNNCYNYACNVATNSFAQPGRKHEISVLTNKSLNPTKVVDGALADGLKLIGNDPLSMDKLASLNPGMGHFVALLTSSPDKPLGWRGDFHWVRSDNNRCTSWSQKYGSGQVANFDFSGMPIIDPVGANWEINQGPQRHGGKTAIKVNYEFRAWMFVPYGPVEII